jgi:hypothetical protein
MFMAGWGLDDNGNDQNVPRLAVSSGSASITVSDLSAGQRARITAPIDLASLNPDIHVTAGPMGGTRFTVN